MKKGNLLLLLITILIIAMVVIYSILIIKGKNNQEKPPIISNNVNTEIKELTNRVDYYAVKNCVNKFYKYYSTMFDSKEDTDIAKTYTILDEEYIDFVGITNENMLTILPRKGDMVTNIDSIWVSQQDEDIYAYIVNGLIREKLTNDISNFQIIIRADSTNKTFSVILQDYIQTKYKDIKIGDTLRLDSIKNIEANRYNLYVIEDISDDTYAIDLFNDYKEEILYNPELAYEHLDVEYESIKFGTVGKFKKYLEENKARNTIMEIKQYQKVENDGYVQYICVDQYGRYYIFKEQGIMNYSLVLDTYTIDLPEFLKKYNVANTVERVGYNIQKCLDAINYEDYSYVYDKLDLEFRALNYPTLDIFKNEIKNKLFEQNEVKSVASYNEGTTYIYKLTITDVDDNSKEQKMTVIMQLKEGTDFVMSLSFQ